MKLRPPQRLVCVLLSMGSLATLALAQSPPLQLDQALAGLEQSLPIQQAQQQLAQAQAALEQAQAQAGVRANAGGQGTYQFAVPGSPNVLDSSFQLALSLPLGPATSGVAKAMGDFEAAQARLQQARADERLKLVQAYAQALRSDKQLEVDQLRFKVAQQQTAALEIQAQTGAATNLQVLNARLAQDTAQHALYQAEYNQREAHASLNALLGLRQTPPLVLAALPALPSPELLQGAVSNSPALRLARVQVLQADLVQQSTSLQSIPSLNVGVGYQGNQLGSGLSFSTQDYNLRGNVSYQLSGALPSTTNLGAYATLGATIPIWDGGGAAAAQRSAQASLRAAQTNLEQTRLDIVRKLEAALGLTQLDAQAIGPQQEAVQIAQQGLSEAQQRLTAGTATPLDLLAAQLQQNLSQQALLQAKLAYLEDLYKLYALLGIGGAR